MAKKFIPNGDLEFKKMAFRFALVIAKDPSRCAVSEEDSRAMSEAFERFDSALQEARQPGARSQIATRLKEEAREEAEKIIRRLANAIRGNASIGSLVRFELGMPERAEKPKSRPCPQEPPRLKFERALHAGSVAAPMHELRFGALEWGKRRPEGAVRVELFVDLVPPDAEIPSHPGANHGGRPWYLRSFTRSPIVIAPPTMEVPMRVVYWARWVDSVGNVGPFSATVAGWIEGGSRAGLPGSVALDIRRKPMLPEEILREPAESSVSVRVVAARYHQLNAQEVVPVDRQLDAA